MENIYKRVTAKLLTQKANETCEEAERMYFRHTFNPDYYLAYTPGNFWIDSVYGFKYSVEDQIEKLSYVLDYLKEGVDYVIEIN